MKYFILILLFYTTNIQAFDYSNFIKGCNQGAKLGQKFLQSAHLTKDLTKIKLDCKLSNDLKKELEKLSSQESFIYGCGSGVSLSLSYYKQLSILRSPRTQKIIENCHQ